MDKVIGDRLVGQDLVLFKDLLSTFLRAGCVVLYDGRVHLSMATRWTVPDFDLQREAHLYAFPRLSQIVTIPEDKVDRFELEDWRLYLEGDFRTDL